MDNYGGVDGHLRAQSSVPSSQKKAALKDIKKKYEDARAAFRGARSTTERDRYMRDMEGAEIMRKKVQDWD